MSTISLTKATLDIAADLGYRFISRYDRELILKLMSNDCGLSNISEDEVIFSKKVLQAICRISKSPSYIPLRNRLQECFGDRPWQVCLLPYESCFEWVPSTDSCRQMSLSFSGAFLYHEDRRLISKLSEKDCGSLSKMSPNVEGCFRKYVYEAIDRTHYSKHYLKSINRFHECFANRPEFQCNDWLTRTDVFE